MPSIVTISGTSRPGNYTSFAVQVVNDELRKRERDVTYLDAREMTLSFPGTEPTKDTLRLRTAIREADAVVLGTPEYHGSFSAMTKLIIENLGFPSAMKNKPVALLGVAAGRIGAIKSLEHLRSVCSHVGAIVLPQPLSIAGVQGVFDEQGRCLDEATEQALHGFVDGLLDFIKQYVCPKYVLEEAVRSGTVSWTSGV